MTLVLSEQLRYTIEREMKEANGKYWTWRDTSVGRGNSPGSIEKLKSFAGNTLLAALEQGLVVIIMHSEYSMPRFEWAKNGRNGNGVYAGRKE